MPTAREANSPVAFTEDAVPVVIEVAVRIKALAFREADGGYSIVVPELPGCHAEADSIEEAREQVIDAAESWLDVQHDYFRENYIRLGAVGSVMMARPHD